MFQKFFPEIFWIFNFLIPKIALNNSKNKLLISKTKFHGLNLA